MERKFFVNAEWGPRIHKSPYIKQDVSGPNGDPRILKTCFHGYILWIWLQRKHGMGMEQGEECNYWINIPKPSHAHIFPMLGKHPK